MSDATDTDNLETLGLYTCPECSRVYESEIALLFCCGSEADRRWGRSSD